MSAATKGNVLARTHDTAGIAAIDQSVLDNHTFPDWLRQILTGQQPLPKPGALPEVDTVVEAFLAPESDLRVSYPEDLSCDGVEFRFLRSLERVQRAEPPDRPRRAIAYLNDSGEVVLFRKHDGYNNALLVQVIPELPQILPGALVTFGNPEAGNASPFYGQSMPTSNPQLRVDSLPEFTSEDPLILDRPTTFQFPLGFGSLLGFKDSYNLNHPSAEIAARAGELSLAEISLQTQRAVDEA